MKVSVVFHLTELYPPFRSPFCHMYVHDVSIIPTPNPNSYNISTFRKCELHQTCHVTTTWKLIRSVCGAKPSLSNQKENDHFKLYRSCFTSTRPKAPVHATTVSSRHVEKWHRSCYTVGHPNKFKELSAVNHQFWTTIVSGARGRLLCWKGQAKAPGVFAYEWMSMAAKGNNWL